MSSGFRNRRDLDNGPAAHLLGPCFPLTSPVPGRHPWAAQPGCARGAQRGARAGPLQLSFPSPRGPSGGSGENGSLPRGRAAAGPPGPSLPSEPGPPRSPARPWPGPRPRAPAARAQAPSARSPEGSGRRAPEVRRGTRRDPGARGFGAWLRGAGGRPAGGPRDPRRGRPAGPGGPGRGPGGASEPGGARGLWFPGPGVGVGEAGRRWVSRPRLRPRRPGRTWRRQGVQRGLPPHPPTKESQVLRPGGLGCDTGVFRLPLGSWAPSWACRGAWGTCHLAHPFLLPSISECNPRALSSPFWTRGSLNGPGRRLWDGEAVPLAALTVPGSPFRAPAGPGSQPRTPPAEPEGAPGRPALARTPRVRTRIQRDSLAVLPRQSCNPKPGMPVLGAGLLHTKTCVNYCK